MPESTTLLKKRISCEFCEIFKNTFFNITTSVLLLAIMKRALLRESNSVNKVKATEVVKKLMDRKAFLTG